MAQSVIQTSFHAGEWAPALNARVDLAKYHAGAALLRNFFVDYRGGASSAPGTKYVLQAKRSDLPVRLVPFAASFEVNYVLEFGQSYVRFYADGAPVLETGKNITAITKANPGVISSVGHGFSIGDWVFLQNIGGMTQLNGRYGIVAAAGFTANAFSLTDLFGVAIDTTSYTTYTSGGTASRVYTLPSPYLAVDLALLKFAQNQNTLVLCHPSYVPYILTFTSNANWSLAPITFGSTVNSPTSPAVVTTGAGIMNYSYVITSVDPNGQESAVSSVVASSVANTAGNQAITVSWTAATGAVSYNLYRAGPAVSSVVPTGSSFGFVTNVTGVSHVDSFTTGLPVIPADYTETIPIVKNPFQGAGVTSATITAAGSYTGTSPSVTFAAAPSGGVTATGLVSAQIQGTPTVAVSGIGHAVGDILDGQFITCSVVVASVDGAGHVLTFQPITFPGSVPGSILTGNSIPANPVNFINRNTTAFTCTVNLVWGIGAVILINHGAGYTSVPAVTFSGGGGGAATAVLEATSAGNPQVPIFFDQRLVFGARPTTPQTFNGSQPKAYFNFNVSDPIQPDDAYEGTLVAAKLNTIKSFIPMSAGLIALADQQAWLINGGGSGVPPTPIDLAANSQAYNGASDVPPIIANLDILYVQAKGSSVRDLTFNFYTNIYTGTDISVLSSHLFYGFQITEWAYAEEPFKLVWAVRNDGQLLCLTFVKEQEMIGWAHRDTQGLFKSICSITETVTLSNGRTMNVDAVYVCVQRTVNGQTLQYIERMAERIFPYGAEDAWCVDSGLQTVPTTPGLTNVTFTVSSAAVGAAVVTASVAFFSGAAVGQVLRMSGGVMTIVSLIGPSLATQVNVTITKAVTVLDSQGNPAAATPGTWSIWNKTTTFTGGEHLAGKTVTGLADGAVITPFVMPSNGSFTLSPSASKVTIGLAYTPQLKTLQLDVGQPTVQGKRKKIVDVSVRCQDTLGLSIGKTFSSSSQVPMKDLVIGNLGTQTGEVVTLDMVTGDALTVIDPSWDVPGQYCIQQSNPYPASILGVIPDIALGDS